MARYEPLTHFLSARREGEVRLTFKEIESALGRALPPSARKHQAWWANTPSHSHADAWLRLGRRTERLDLADQQVSFVKHAVPTGVAEQGAPYDTKSGEGALTLRPGAINPEGWRVIRKYAAENHLSLEDAAAALLNGLWLERRRRLLAELRARPPQPFGTPSADLIREDRDAR